MWILAGPSQKGPGCHADYCSYIAACYGFPLARTSGAYNIHHNPDVYFNPGDYQGKNNETMALAYCVSIPTYDNTVEKPVYSESRAGRAPNHGNTTQHLLMHSCTTTNTTTPVQYTVGVAQLLGGNATSTCDHVTCPFQHQADGIVLYGREVLPRYGGICPHELLDVDPLFGIELRQSAFKVGTQPDGESSCVGELGHVSRWKGENRRREG
jgi:hypothetical protein